MESNPNRPNLEIKPNSDKSKSEHVARTPVVTGNVTSRKTSLGKKFADTFFSDDISNVKHYILFDVLIPGIRDGLYDIFSGSLSMMFYGDSGRRSAHGQSKSKAGYVNYSSYSSSKPKSKSTVNSVYSYNDIIFDTREDANEVKFTMQDILEKYGMVTIADFYELSGEESDFTDQKYGWFNLDNMTLVRDRDGYKIKMPKAVPLD